VKILKFYLFSADAAGLGLIPLGLAV